MPARAASRRFRHSLGGLCLLALLLLPLLHLWPALNGLNNAHLDWLIRQRAAEQTPDPRLLLIDIDDLSLQVLASGLSPTALGAPSGLALRPSIAWRWHR